MATYTGADKRLQYLFEHGGGGGGSANIWTGTMAEYLAQASQIADGTQINITDDEIQSLVVASYDIYSEEEREVGVWIDGKPVYSRTVKYGYAPNNSTVSVNHNISDIDRIINAVGRGWNSSNGTFYPIPFVQRSQVGYQIQFTANKTSIEVATGSNLFTAVEIIVTMLYTKTTDAAGSGLFVPSGAGAVHYSTEEQIIGTYLGNTLYSKTISIPSATMTNGTMNIVVSADYSNVDKLVSWECNIYDPTLQRNFNIPYIRITDSESLYLLVHRISDHTVNAAIFCRGSGYNNRTFQNIEFSLQYTKTT